MQYFYNRTRKCNRNLIEASILLYNKEDTIGGINRNAFILVITINIQVILFHWWTYFTLEWWSLEKGMHNKFILEFQNSKFK